jgi:transposase InsO family protein
LAEARQTIEVWSQDYSQCRLHSVLGYRTPEEFAKTSDGTVEKTI